MVKWSQVVASAFGAVASAVIASFFGVKGTIIGIAIGSVIATTASAFAVKSIEHTHRAVRRVVVDQNPLVRRVGATRAAGRVAASEVEAAPPRVPLARSAGTTSGRPPAPVHLAGPPRPPARRTGSGWAVRARGAVRARRVRWLLSGAAAFAMALLAVTLIELGAGRPLAALVGASGTTSGTTVGNLGGSPAPSPAPSTTTTTLPSATTTTPSPATTTTTTTTLPSATTTTAAPGATTTTAPVTTTTTGPSAGGASGGTSGTAGGGAGASATGGTAAGATGGA